MGTENGRPSTDKAPASGLYLAAGRFAIALILPIILTAASQGQAASVGKTSTRANSRLTPQQVKEAFASLLSARHSVRWKALKQIYNHREQLHATKRQIADIIMCAKLELDSISSGQRDGCPATAAKPSGPLPLIGTEADILQVKADPSKYIGKKITICGTGALTDYYNDGYREDPYTAIAFAPLSKRGIPVPGCVCYLYVGKAFGRPLRKMLSKPPWVTGSAAPMRMTVELDPAHFDDSIDDWNMFTVTDWQVLKRGGKGWTDPRLQPSMVAFTVACNWGNKSAAVLVHMLLGLNHRITTATRQYLTSFAIAGLLGMARGPRQFAVSIINEHDHKTTAMLLARKLLLKSLR